MLGLFVAVVCVRALLSTAQGSRRTTVLYERFAQHLRQSLFEAISGAQWRFICKSRSSDFVHALTNEVDRAARAAHQGLSMLSGAVDCIALYDRPAWSFSPPRHCLMLGLCAALSLLLRAKTRAVLDAGSDYSDVAAQRLRRLDRAFPEPQDREDVRRAAAHLRTLRAPHPRHGARQRRDDARATLPRTRGSRSDAP